MKRLSLKDAAVFYKRFYAPNNAVLVVAGDVTAEEVRPLAQATYGRNKPNTTIPQRSRAQEPPASSNLKCSNAASCSSTRERAKMAGK